jgi:hypothetical protein
VPVFLRFETASGKKSGFGRGGLSPGLAPCVFLSGSLFCLHGLNFQDLAQVMEIIFGKKSRNVIKIHKWGNGDLIRSSEPVMCCFC